MRLLLTCLLAVNGCVTGQKLLLDRDPEVYSRATGQKCQRVWFTITETGMDEAFGGECDIVIRRSKYLIFDSKTNEWVIPK